MAQTKNINASLGTVEKETVFGAASDAHFEPISTEPTITFGGTSYRWVTQLSINNKKFGSAEGPAAKDNLVVERGEYINSVQSAHLYGGYNFITQIKFTTNRGKTWVLEGAEAPSKTKEKYESLDLKGIRVLSIGGSHGGLGDSLKQLQIRYLANYDVEDEPQDLGGEPLYGILDVSGEGSIEYYQSSEVRNLEAITAISEFSANVETEVTQSYLLAEATSRFGFSYMNRQELRTETENVQKVSTKTTIDIKSGMLGLGICQLEVKKLKGKKVYLLIPKDGKTIVPYDTEKLKKTSFFDFSSSLRFMVPDLKFSSKYGWDNYHKGK